MYWLFVETTDPFETADGSIQGLNFAKDVETAVGKALDPSRIEKFYLTLENDAKKLNTQIANGLSSNLKSIQTVIYDVYKEGLQYGFAYGDAKDYMEALQSASQKMVTFTSDNVKQAILLGKAIGVGAKEMGALYASFTQYGYGQAMVNEKLTKIIDTARKSGVDVSVLTKTIGDNIFKAQIYGFKNGVEGLTKMAVQAQRVGVNLDMAAKAADKAFDPEGAIEMASTMQMLGGSVGALADPFQLMNMAQSDMGALQDQILKSSASMVDFNSKTGEFKISPEMRRNLTEYAKSMNMSYDEVAKNAVKFRKEQEVLSRIPLTGGMTEEEKSLIASLAEIGPNGQVNVKIPGTETLIPVEDLKAGSQAMLDLKAAQKDAEKKPEDIAREQLSVQDKMAKTLEEIKNAGIFGVGQQKGLQIPEKIDDKLIGVAKTFGQTLETNVNTYGVGNTIVQTYTNTLTTLNTVITNSTSNMTTLIADMERRMKKTASETADGDGDGFVGTADSDDADPSVHDFFLPPGTNRMVSTGFGDMINFKPDNRDALLGAPEEDINNMIKFANLGEKFSNVILENKNLGETMINAIPKEKSFEKNTETLTQYVEQKIVNENNTNVKLGVEPISVSVKLDGTNISKEDISKLIDTNEINNAVVERLRDIFDETKLINSIPRLKI